MRAGTKGGGGPSGFLQHRQHRLNGGGPVGLGQVGVGAEARDDAVHKGRVEPGAAGVRLPEAEHLGQPADDGFVGIAVLDLKLQNFVQLVEDRVHEGDCTRRMEISNPLSGDQ